MKHWNHPPRINYFDAVDVSQKHICHYRTQVAVTGDVGLPADAAMRAAILYIAQNLDLGKLPAAYELLTNLSQENWASEDLITDGSVSKISLKPPASITFEQRAPFFFDDDA